jgi:hypothetical protein
MGESLRERSELPAVDTRQRQSMVEFSRRGTESSTSGNRIMTTQVNATVIGGMLKPDESLPLPDDTRVKLTIEPITEEREPEEAGQSLKEWIRRNPLHGLGRHLTRDELHERR